MRRIALRAAVGVMVAFGVVAAPASAAPPCENIHAEVRGLSDGDPVATGRSTAAITISGQDEGEISNVVASFPAPASVQATLTGRGKFSLAMNLPSAGSVTLTVSWDELTASTPPGSTERVVTCTQTTRIALRAVKPAAIGVRGENTGFENGIVARFPLYGCKAPLVAAPVTVTVRYRLGPKRRAFGPVPIPRAPTARSPKLVFVVAKPCGDTVARQRVALPGRGSVSGGKSAGGQFEVIAARRAPGRYAYGAHLRVEFAQPGFKTVRFDVTGYFSLGAGGKASGTTVRRLR
jgi:hypothetical protein